MLRTLVLHLHGRGIDGEAHGVQAVVDVHGDAGAGAGEGRAEEERRAPDVVRLEVAAQGRVGLGVVAYDAPSLPSCADSALGAAA